MGFKLYPLFFWKTGTSASIKPESRVLVVLAMIRSATAGLAGAVGVEEVVDVGEAGFVVVMVGFTVGEDIEVEVVGVCVEAGVVVVGVADVVGAAEDVGAEVAEQPIKDNVNVRIRAIATRINIGRFDKPMLAAFAGVMKRPDLNRLIKAS